MESIDIRLSYDCSIFDSSDCQSNICMWNTFEMQCQARCVSFEGIFHASGILLTIFEMHDWWMCEYACMTYHLSNPSSPCTVADFYRGVCFLYNVPGEEQSAFPDAISFMCTTPVRYFSFLQA